MQKIGRIQGFDIYLTATGIGEKDEKIQVATFLHVAGIEARRVYNTFGISADDADKIDVLKTRFKEYCEPRKNLTYIRHVFFTRNQGPDEPIDNYVTDLKTKAQPCEFGNLSDGLIRDRIVCGIHDEACRARLLRESDLTLAKAIDVCRAQEMSTKQLKSLKGSEEQTVAAISQSKSGRKVSSQNYSKHTKHAKQRTGNQRPDSTDGRSCRNCGRRHMKDSCPAFWKPCHRCHNKNHFAKYCLTEPSYNSKKFTLLEYQTMKTRTRIQNFSLEPYRLTQ